MQLVDSVIRTDGRQSLAAKHDFGGQSSFHPRPEKRERIFVLAQKSNPESAHGYPVFVLGSQNLTGLMWAFQVTKVMRCSHRVRFRGAVRKREPCFRGERLSLC